MNTGKNEALCQRDLAVLWHPTTQMKDHEWLPLLPVKKAQRESMDLYAWKQGRRMTVYAYAMRGIDLAKAT